MTNRLIYNFNFAVADEETRQQLGTVTITKEGDLKVSPTVVKRLYTEELVKLCQDVLDAYSILKTGRIDSGIFSFTLQKGKDRYHVQQKVLDKKYIIGCILIRDKRLIFDSDVPEYIRMLCIEILNKQHETDFYYQGSHYDGN